MNICDTCCNKNCPMQSGIKREKCDFYISKKAEDARKMAQGFHRNIDIFMRKYAKMIAREEYIKEKNINCFTSNEDALNIKVPDTPESDNYNFDEGWIKVNGKRYDIFEKKPKDPITDYKTIQEKIFHRYVCFKKHIENCLDQGLTRDEIEYLHYTKEIIFDVINELGWKNDLEKYEKEDHEK